MEKNRQSMIIDLIDDNDISTYVLDDDECDNDKTCSLVMIDDSLVNINNTTLNATVTSRRSPTIEIDDDCDLITIDDEDDDSIVLPNQKQQSEKSNIDKKSIENNDVAGPTNKKQPDKLNISEKSVEIEDTVELTNKIQPGKSNIGEISFENWDIIEVFNRKQPEKSNISIKSVECINKSSNIDENGKKCGKMIDRGQCKRKRGVNCTNSETDDSRGKKVKVDNAKFEGGSTSNTNLVTDEALNLSESCADKSSISGLNGRIRKKNPGRQKKRQRKQNKLREALRNSLQNDANNLAYCFRSLHSSPSGLKDHFSEKMGGGERKKKKREGGGERNNGENENEVETCGADEKNYYKEGDEKTKNEEENSEGDKQGEAVKKNNESDKKTNNSEVYKKNESDKKTKEDDDVILVTSTEPAPTLWPPSWSFPSGRTRPANGGRNKEVGAAWSRPAHLAQMPNPVTHFLGQMSQMLKGAAASSNVRATRQNFVPVSNSAQLSSIIAQISANNNKLGMNGGGGGGPMLLNVSPTTSNNTNPTSQEVIVINDSASKVFKPRGDPVPSNSNQLSLVGNNIFIPSSMPASSNVRATRQNFVPVSNSAQLSSIIAQISANNNKLGMNGGGGPMLLNVSPTTSNNTNPTSQDSQEVIVIDDSASKVFKPRADPVPSKSNQLSLVGNNIFIPSSMPAKTGPRPVFIDGCNVAFSHGRHAVFSVKGIEICVEYFRRLGNKAFVVLPNHRKAFLSDATLNAWERDGTLVVTPSRRINHNLVASEDDRYVIQCAAAMDGVIVTSDQYRDHMGINPIWDETIQKRLLMLTWMMDILIFPDDPLGRHGPKLKDFLMY